MYQSTSVAAAWDCLRRGDVNGAVGASAASRASSSGTSATGRVTDVAASRRRRCSASQWRRRRAKTQSSQLLVSKGADASRIIESALLDESILRILLLAGRDLKLSQPSIQFMKFPMNYITLFGIHIVIGL